MKQRRLLLAFIILAFFLSVSIQPASAHANLEGSTPEVNAHLDQAPVLVELVFSEPIEPNFSSIEVLDSTGKRVDNDDSTVDSSNPLRMTATIRSLGDGIYTVSWKTLSLVDSHVTAGVFPFAVGNVDAGALESAAAASQKFSLSSGEVIFRWLSYLATAAMAGGVLFVTTVWNPALQMTWKDKNPAIAPPWRTMAAGALTVLVAANIFGLLAQAGQVSGLGFVLPWNSVLGRLLFATKYGALWLGRFFLTLIVVRILIFAKKDQDRWIAFAVTLIILFTFSLNSHAAAEPRPFFPVAADWLHLVGASVWVGGLVYFVGGLWAAREVEPADRIQFTARLIPRFSALAISSVGLIGLTGLYSAFLRVGSLDALTSTLYGRVLMVKTLLFLPMLMLGAINLLNTSPAMHRAAGQEDGDVLLVYQFRNLVSMEVGFAVLLLLTVGLFTAIPPARTIATETAIRQTAQADDLHIQIEIDPGKVGINTFNVNITSDGVSVPGAREVTLQFTPTGVDLPPSQITLNEMVEGIYSAEGAFLSLPDTWQIQVAVRREGTFDAFANFKIPVGTIATTDFPWNRANGFLLLLGALIFLQTLRSVEKNKAREWKTVRAPAIALVIAAVFVFFLPSNEEETLANPIPPNRESIAAGQAIYRVQCLQCHGPTGRGDGPVGLTLNPPPADLYQHTQPGVHPDGRLYDWITNGFPGNSQMPVFKNILTDEERWNIINYIRTFARNEDESPGQP